MLLDYFHHLLVQVFSFPERQFCDGIHASFFQQIGVLTSHTFDAEQVGAVDPPQDLFFAEAAFFAIMVRPLRVAPSFRRAWVEATPAFLSFFVRNSFVHNSDFCLAHLYYLLSKSSSMVIKPPLR